MPRIEPSLVPVVTNLERGLRELGVQFGLVGALVPELLLAVRPPQRPTTSTSWQSLPRFLILSLSRKASKATAFPERGRRIN